MKMILLIVTLITAMYAVNVNAETRLAVICTDASAKDKYVGECATAKYDMPQPTDLVRHCKAPVGTASGCSWEDRSTFFYRELSSLSDNAYIDVCMTNITRGTLVPNPWTAQTDPCKSWFSVLKKDVPVPLNVNGTVTISFEHPTAYVDNMPLNRSDIEHYELEHAPTINAVYSIIDYITDGITLMNVAGGTHCYRLRTVVKTGEKSVPTEPVCIAIVAKVRANPNAPTNVRIIIE